MNSASKSHEGCSRPWLPLLFHLGVTGTAYLVPRSAVFDVASKNRSDEYIFNRTRRVLPSITVQTIIGGRESLDLRTKRNHRRKITKFSKNYENRRNPPLAKDFFKFYTLLRRSTDYVLFSYQLTKISNSFSFRLNGLEGLISLYVINYRGDD